MALQFQPGQLAGLLPGIISGYGGGTFNPGRGRLEQVPNNPQQMPQAAPEPKKKGLFSKDGDGWKILGIIGDALQAAGGGQGTYAPAMMALQERIAEEERFRRQLQAQAEQRKADRDAAAEEYNRRFGMQREAQRDYYDYQRENPKPVLVPDGMGGAQWITPPAYDEGDGGDLTPMTEDEINALGLPAGGPGKRPATFQR